MNSWWKFGSLSLLIGLLGCGANSAGIDANGGDLCLPQNVLCLRVPPGALTEGSVFRVGVKGDGPPDALSKIYEISVPGRSDFTFVKPAIVAVSFDALTIDLTEAGIDEALLRINTSPPGGEAWEPLGRPVVDRVRNEVRGEVSHLSWFVLFRADRVP